MLVYSLQTRRFVVQKMAAGYYTPKPINSPNKTAQPPNPTRQSVPLYRGKAMNSTDAVMAVPRAHHALAQLPN
jgi:hypothetical protein